MPTLPVFRPGRLLLLLASAAVLTASACGPDSSSSDSKFPGIAVSESDAASVARGDSGGFADGDAAVDAVDYPDGFEAPLPEAPLERSVTERGPYRVGYREIEVVYQAEADGTDDEREIPVAIWYPTMDAEGPPAEYHLLIEREEAISDARLAPIDEFPLLFFSHGNGGIAQQNFFMSEYWASRGWVVVSPSHTGNTLRSGTDIKIEAAIYRPQDVRAVLDRIFNLEETDPLAGRLSDSHVVMSGHSFGGYTTLANSGAEFALDNLQERCENGNASRDYCETFDNPETRDVLRDGFLDERVDVAIPQAPAGAQIFMSGLEELRPPTLLMTGGMDRTLPNEEEGDSIWEYMVGPEHRRLNLPKGGHFTFSNMCDVSREILGSVPSRVEDDGCSEMNIEPERAHRLINVYALAFARYHLWDLDRAIVDGERHPIGEEGFELSVGAE